MPHGLAAILESTEPTFLATGLGATEGPLWHPAGYVIFVDHRGSRALRWDADTGVRVVREQTGEGNGCALDRQGRLIMCEGGHRRASITGQGVIICNGHHWDGRYPDYLSTFMGEDNHSKDYKHPRHLAGKRVLVIGGGNSACDLASEAARHRARCLADCPDPAPTAHTLLAAPRSPRGAASTPGAGVGATTTP
jgi:Flavin-binding monooxygenase-like/SMP-30/Gluconolactonase/LRE-like region